MASSFSLNSGVEMGKKQVQDSFFEDVPTLNESTQQIGKVIENIGDNIYKVQVADATTLLCALLPKFKSTIWIRRGIYSMTLGMFVVVEREEKAKGTIVQPLTAAHVKQLTKEGNFPIEFMQEMKSKSEIDYPPSSDEEEELEE